MSGDAFQGYAQRRREFVAVDAREQGRHGRAPMQVGAHGVRAAGVGEGQQDVGVLVDPLRGALVQCGQVGADQRVEGGAGPRPVAGVGSAAAAVRAALRVSGVGVVWSVNAWARATR